MKPATRVAIASIIGNAVGMQAALRAVMTMFLLPVSAGLGISRGEYLGATAAGPIASALCAILFGRLIDKVGPRRVLVWGLIAFSLAEMLLAAMTASPVVMTIMWAAFGITAATQAPTGYVKAISGWFAERRGIVLGLALGLGGGIGGALLTVIIGFVMDGWGWRASFLVLGVLPLLIGVPALWWGMRDPPQVVADVAGTQTVKAPSGISGREARRTATFWIILIASLLHQIVLSGLNMQFGAMLGDVGLRSSAVGLFVGVFGLAFAGGQALLGFVMDRFDTPKVGLPFFVAGLIGVVAFHYIVIVGGNHSIIVLFVTALLLGLGSGAELALQAYYVGRYFGIRAAGELFGILLCAFALSGAIGGIAFGVTFDKTGSYDLALKVGEVMLVAGIVVLALLKPYTYTTQGEFKTT